MSKSDDLVENLTIVRAIASADARIVAAARRLFGIQDFATGLIAWDELRSAVGQREALEGEGNSDGV